MGTHASIGLHDPARDDAFERTHGYCRTPRLVQWMVTLRCPYTCAHCLAAGVSDELSLDEARRMIADVAALGVEELLLTGGEPTAREDLADIVGLLAEAGVAWSLNTACHPKGPLRAAIESWPPRFVAVSLDGPADLHDRFRGCEGLHDEALASIAYFSELIPGQVAAGTTVTRQSFGRLSETLGIVVGSGASSWGLHLPVPEGRAARRPDLFLTRRQLEQLLSFVAAKRNHFPVTLADEIGYCGALEPLVRDAPFYCGAGRAQCVILPDGEVVPCTTLDRSTSAGNVRQRSLAEIWANAFSDLRRWRPTDECAVCELAVACEGGCWLQRRHGTQCFKQVWQRPRLSIAAAAVGLGLAVATANVPHPAAGGPPGRETPHDFTEMEKLQRTIVQWYASQVGGRMSPNLEEVKKALKQQRRDDPGAAYVLQFISSQRPSALAERADQIELALTTEQRSLCLLGLAWRDLTEWALDSKGPAARSTSERARLRAVTAMLGRTAEAWRQEVFNDKLDPFLRRPQAYRWFFMSKAGPPASVRMEESLATKRGWTQPSITAEFLAEHPYAETMQLSFDSPVGFKVVQMRAGKSAPFDGTLGAFDLLRVEPVKSGTAPRLTLHEGDVTLAITPPVGVELTYGDVLHLLAEQNTGEVEALAHRLARRGDRRNLLPIALPVMRAEEAALGAKPKLTSRESQQLRDLRWYMIDAYLF